MSLPEITAFERFPAPVIYNTHNIYGPMPRREQLPGCEGYPYHMYLMGWTVGDSNPGYYGSDAMFLARGKDLFHWEVYAGEGKWDAAMDPATWVPVITATPAWYDNWHNGDPSVVIKDGTYYMAYSSHCFGFDGIPEWEENDTDGDIECTNAAISTDGVNWTKSAAPILLSPHEKGQTRDSRRQLFKERKFNGYWCRPSLLWDEGKWKLWFDSAASDMGYAENTGDFMDPADWKVLRDGANPCLPNFPNPEVVRIGGRYYAFGDPNIMQYGADFDGKGWTARQLALAVSDDGLDFRIAGWIRPDPDAPAMHVPGCIVEDGYLYMFYATQKGHTLGAEEYDFRYKQVRVMRISVEALAKIK